MILKFQTTNLAKALQDMVNYRMDEIIKVDYYKKAIELWKNKEYNESLFLLENLIKENEDKTIKIILKEKIYVGKTSISFWRSSIIENHFLSFFEDYHSGYYLLKDYFKQEELNLSLLELLISLKEKLLLEIIKNIKLEKNSQHFIAIKEIATKLKADNIIKTLKEMSLLEEIHTELESEIYTKYDSFFKDNSFEYILMLIGIYLENQRLLTRQISENNDTLLAESVYTKLVSKIFERYKYVNLEKIKSYKNITPEEMHKTYLLCILELKQDSTFITQLLQDYSRLDNFEKALDFYYFYNWEIDFSKNPPELKSVSLQEHRTWIKNGFKYFYKHRYKMNFAMCNSQSEMNFKINALNDDLFEFNQRLIQEAMFYKLSKLPNEISFREKEIFNTEEYLYCMNCLVMYAEVRYLKSIHKKTYYMNKEIFYDEILEVYKETRLNGQCIIFRIVDEQIQMIGKDKGKPSTLSEKKIKSIFEIGSSDLLGKKEINLDERPLMKLGSYYFFFANQLSETDFSTSLIEIIEKEILKPVHQSKIDFSHNKWTALYEKYISELFACYGYESSQGTLYGNRNQEIDVLAFKDNTVFLIELKMSHNRIENHSVLDHRRSALLKGGEQLSDAIDYLNTKEGKEDIAARLSISAENIKIIYPLLITNSFEDDYLLISDKYNKISLFELERILLNDRIFMFDPIESQFENDKTSIAQYQDYTRSQIIDLNLNNKMKAFFNNKNSFEEFRKKYSLRSDSEDCSPQYIIDCINNDRVWRELDKSHDYSFYENDILVRGVKKLKYFL